MIAAAGRDEKSVLSFFGVLLALVLPGLLAQAAHPAAGLAWTELFAFLLPALVAAAGSNLRPAVFLRLRPPRAPIVALGALAGAAGYLLAGGMMALWERLLPRTWVELFDLGRIFEGPPWERAVLALLAVVVAPACEEIAFRGYALSALLLRFRPRAAIAVAALLFALLHLDPIRFPALLVLGALFGWLSWRGGSVWPAVAAHATNNAVAAGLVLAAGGPPPEPQPLPAIALALALGGAALGPLILAYRAMTPAPAPGEELAARRDPAEPSIRFSAARVPASLTAAAFAGALSLAGFLAWALAHPRPPR